MSRRTVKFVGRDNPKRCETCRYFNGCDLDDPDDEVGKCWLDVVEGNQTCGYYPWINRLDGCGDWAPPEPESL